MTDHDELLAEINARGYANFSAMTKADMEREAQRYADAEYAKLDDPTLSDIEVHERYLGIDSPEVRAAFDERLVLKRAGVDVDEMWNDIRLLTTPSDALAAHKAMYAEYAAEMRNPAPDQHGPHPDPKVAADIEKTMTMLIDELYTRSALKKWLRKQRRDALLAGQQREYFEREAEQRRESRRAMNLAIPVVLEGELLPATRPRSR